MKRVIIVNGVARCGKDTFVNYLVDLLDKPTFKLSSIDKIKQFTSAILGVEQDKTDKYRKFLSNIKDEWTEYNDGPFKHMVSLIDKYMGDFKTSVVTVMVREPDEIEKLERHYGDDCVTVLISRTGIETPNNHADEDVQDYDYDIYIDNSGSIDDFKKEIEFFAKKTVNRAATANNYVTTNLRYTGELAIASEYPEIYGTISCADAVEVPQDD